MCYSTVCFVWMTVVHFKVYIQYSFFAQFKALPFLYVWIKSLVKNSLQDKELAGKKFVSPSYSMWTGFFTFCDAVFLFINVSRLRCSFQSYSIKTQRCFNLKRQKRRYISVAFRKQNKALLVSAGSTMFIDAGVRVWQIDVLGVLLTRKI